MTGNLGQSPLHGKDTPHRALLASEGVRYNTIYPGFIDTDMTHGAFGNPDFQPFFLSQIPLGRMGKPEDVAMGALFLASDAASWVTGENLVIDGGQLCN